ncbi:unnamed protein product [Mesocestoides corti]|uniref:RRM domain-containing protein n=1 Tax=Mesocestoides corti TaxID=53468 RepID=A0A0R3UNR4_MESCO|nr:unnamed protein product [Mesocestoides corti]
MTEYKASDLVEMARSRMGELKISPSVPYSHSDVYLIYSCIPDELNSRTLLLGHLPRNTTLKKLITVFKDSINARFPRKKFKGNRKFVNFACQINIFAHFVKTVLEDLQSLFPNAKDIFLPHAGPEKTLGSARIDFVDEDDAIAAFTSKHGSMVHNSPIIVNFCVRRKSGKRKRAEHEQKLSSDDTQVQKIEIPANSTAESVQVGVISKQIRKARKRRLSANSGAKVSTPSKSPKTPTRGTGVKRRRSCLNKSTKPQSIKLK